MNGFAEVLPQTAYPPLQEVPKIQEIPPQREEYARSLDALRRMGSPAVRACAGFEAYQPVETLAYDNYTSSLREMLKTDAEFREQLDIDDKREHDVVDGMVRDKEGAPMIELIRTGREVAEAAAVWQPELKAQAIRDAGDEFVAEKVDELQPGQALFALSRVPSHELREHTKTYRGLGYREGLSFLQWYARDDENTLVAGSFSIDQDDDATWHEMFADQGVEVPEGESPNTWIQHVITKEMTAEQAEQFAQDIRHEYYQRRGATNQRHSISEYVNANEATVKNYFDAYYPALAQAINSKRNNETLQGLAKAILDTDVTKLKPEIRQQLLKVSNGQQFDDELGKSMDGVIRYAVVEELRKGLTTFMSNGSEYAQSAEGSKTNISGLVTTRQGELSANLTAAELNQRMAGNIESGVKAGRSYGGCSETDLSVDGEEGDETNADPQSAYGGKSENERRYSKSSKLKCVMCRAPTTMGQVEQKDKGTWRCPHCKYEVDVCTGQVKHRSVLPGSAPPGPETEEASESEESPKAEKAPVISLEEKRNEKQMVPEQPVPVGPVVQKP